MDPSMMGWRRYILVQPPVMMLLFAFSMSGTVLTDFIVYNVCKITLYINNTECLILHENSTSAEALRLNTIIQPEASLIIMSKSFIENILPAFMSLFLGPWSDKYGRKPLMLSGYLGISITYTVLAIMINWEIDPWYLLVAFVPTGLLGGFCLLLLASLCYITDISDTHDRVWHLGWFQVLISVGYIMGLFTGPIIYNSYGYSAVFVASCACCVIAFLYILFLVPETVHSHCPSMWSSVFDVSLVKDLISTCVEKRDGYKRQIVWCCIICLTLNVITMEGDMIIGYLFTSARLGWDVTNYSIYSGSNVLLGIIGMFLGMKVLTLCTELPDAIMAIISITSALGSAITRAFAYKAWHMYLAISIGTLGGIASPTIRAILSKSVPPQDAGKLFSLTTSIETLTPFGATSLYSMIYSHFMPPLYPSPVWFVSAAIFVIIAILLIYMHIRISRVNVNVHYSPFIQDTD